MNRDRFFRIIMTALTLALAAALCLSVLAVCHDGMSRRREMGSSTEPIFTRKGVAARFERILPLFALWGIGAIASLTVGIPARNARNTGTLSERVFMKGMPESRKRTWARAALCAAAIALMALGVFNGGLNDVLVKAINICTECIGLG